MASSSEAIPATQRGQSGHLTYQFRAANSRIPNSEPGRDLTVPRRRVSLRHSLPDHPPIGGFDMSFPRLVSRSVVPWLAVALVLAAVVSTVVPGSSPVSAAAKSKIVLAWHAGFASRWLDPQ